MIPCRNRKLDVHGDTFAYSRARPRTWGPGNDRCYGPLQLASCFFPQKWPSHHLSPNSRVLSKPEWFIYEIAIVRSQIRNATPTFFVNKIILKFCVPTIRPSTRHRFVICLVRMCLEGGRVGLGGYFPPGACSLVAGPLAARQQKPDRQQNHTDATAQGSCDLLWPCFTTTISRVRMSMSRT